MSSGLGPGGAAEAYPSGSSGGNPTSLLPREGKPVSNILSAEHQVYSSEWSASEKASVRKVLSKKATNQSLDEAPDPPVVLFEVPRTVPWITKDGVELNWSPLRKKVALVVTHYNFDTLISFFIVLNFCLIVYEADRDAMCYPKYHGREQDCPFSTTKMLPIKILDVSFLILYSVEALFQLYVSRLRYFQSRWHQLDAIVLVAGWTGELATGMMNLNFLRIIRVMRLTKALRVVLGIRELYLLLNGFMCSMRAIFFGTILLLMILLGLAIVMVEMVHPINSRITYYGCSECTIGYHSVAYAVVTLFKQLIAGDSWIISFPVLDEAPWTAVIMLSIVVIVMLGITNLILTVIVERAAEAREKDREDLAKQKVRSQQQTKKELMKICARMDADSSGTLTKDELLQAFHVHADFRNIMMMLDVQEGDLEAIFKLLDQDSSGDLDYEEFCEELIQLETQDQRLSLAMTRLGVVELRQIQGVMDSKLGNVIQTLDSHSSCLQRLDSKLDKLLGTSPGLHASGKFEKPRKSLPESMDLQKIDRREGNGTAAKSTSGGVDIAGDLTRMAQDMKHASVLQSDIVQRVEQQIIALRSHSEIVVSVMENYLFLDDGSPHVSQNPVTIARGKLCGLSGKLHENLQRMNDALSDGVQKFGHVARSIDANQRLLQSLKHEVVVLSESVPKQSTPAELKPSWPRLSDPFKNDIFLCTI